MENKDFIIEKDGKQFVDVVKLLPDRTSEIREIVKELDGDKVAIYSRIRAKSKGSGSKKVTINRFIELDELFFEGLGLWQAEGGKSRGIYFGNTSIEILKRFIEFVENKLEVFREEFKVHLIIPTESESEVIIKKEWSDTLQISPYRFTKISVKANTNLEYAHLYFNSEILVELFRLLYEKLKSIIVQSTDFASAFMRGIIAGESQVELKPWGTMNYISISSKDLKEVDFYKQCLIYLGIKSGTYDNTGMKFPIYGKDNFEKIRDFRLIDLHPKKKSKFEIGMRNYQRTVSDPKIIEALLLNHLTTPKTYTELSKLLNKGRSTIQAFYIPRLEKKGLLKRIGKQNRAWLFQRIDKELIPL